MSTFQTNNATQSLSNAAQGEFTSIWNSTPTASGGGSNVPTYSAGRITVKTAGVYLAVGVIQWATNATGMRGVWISANDTSGNTRIGEQNLLTNTAGDNTRMCSTGIWKASANQFFSMWGYQTSGAGLANVVGVTSYFGVIKLS